MRTRDNMIACFAVRANASGQSHEFLQMRRTKRDYMGGSWQTVFGASKGDSEPLWQAALRELREETGLIPREFFTLPTVRAFYIAEDDTIWRYASFCAMVDRADEVALNEEHDAFRWIARDDVGDSFIWQTDRDAIAELCREILDDGPAKPYLRIQVE